MTDCLFCRMVAGELKPDVVYEDEHVMAFRDINPQAPIHVLVIPKKHISTINDLGDEDVEVTGWLVHAAKRVAHMTGIDGSGYRTVMNCNNDGGQTVFHLHLHLLGGRRMHWPPG